MHLVVVPLTVVLTTVRPGVNALAMDVVVNKVTRVSGAIGPEELTVAVFLAVFVLTFVTCIVRPYLFAFAVLLVLKPPSFISGAISVVIDSIAVCFIILPVTIVYVTISMDEATSSVCFVVFPVALIKRAVNPDLDTTAILSALFVPLAFVLSSIVERDHLLSDSYLSVICRKIVVLEWFEGCANLHNESPCFLHLCVGLSVSCSLVIVHSFCFKAVLIFDRSTSHHTTIVCLNFSSSRLLIVDLCLEVSTSGSRRLSVV